MLKNFLKICKGIIFILFTVSLHLAISYLLPFPYNAVNVILVMCVLHIVWFNKGYIVWLAFFSFLFVELYTSQPFGLHLVAGTLGTIIVYWLMQYLFTHRSWYTVIALSAIATISYRLIYLLFFSAFHLLITSLVFPPAYVIFSLYGLELVFTATTTLMLFFLLKPFMKKWSREQQLYTL